MKRKSASPGMNFWPGYVDAMTNVVLNLLFMVAMFGIALAVFNATPHSSALKKPGDRDEPSAAPEDSSGPVLGGVDGRPRSGNVAEGLAMPSTAVQPGASRQAASDIAGRFGGSARTPVPQRPATGIAAGPGAGNLPSGQPAAQETVATQRAAVVARQSLAVDQPSILIADAFVRNGGPQVRVARRAGQDGAVLLLVDVPKGAEPFAAMSKPSVQRLLREGLGTSGNPILIWTSANLNDPVERRAAFLAIAAARNAIIAVGASPDTVTTKLLQGSAGTAEAMQLFIQSAATAATGVQPQPSAVAAQTKAKDEI